MPPSPDIYNAAALSKFISELASSSINHHDCGIKSNVNRSFEGPGSDDNAQIQEVLIYT
jgi:hypothetical protein